MDNHLQGVKLVVNGGGATGKTCLLMSFIAQKFPKDYIPSVFEPYVEQIEVEGQMVELGLWDTTEEYDRVRPLSYNDTDVFLMCFSIANPASFTNITSRWYPEIRHYCPTTPVLLVGTKIDLRDNPLVLEKLAQYGKKPIQAEEGMKMAKSIGVHYYECSALTKKNINTLFKQATIIGMRKESHNHCTVL